MMNLRNLILAVLSLFVTAALMAQTYEYPFQNPGLPDDERIDNLLSLMTLEEKIATFSGAGVPRLGVPNPGSSEAIHGLVRGGSTDLESFVRNSQLDKVKPAQQRMRPTLVNSTAFPQGYGLGETWDKEILMNILWNFREMVLGSVKQDILCLMTLREFLQLILK